MVFEVLAYAVGFAVYRALRRRRGDFLDDPARWSVMVAVVLGAAVGSKLLHHLNHLALLAEHAGDPRFLLGGKTIVGALLGGWLAVEWTKRRLGIVRRTGDLFALPLAVGIAVGRVGCILAGPADGTHGSVTDLSWGIDSGDGLPRHPVLLLEILFVSIVGVLVTRRRSWLARDGARFRFFLGSYLAFRVAVDFLKPAERFGGLSAIQWAALAGFSWLAFAALCGSARAGTEGRRESAA